jgi:hypothetical protein
MSRKSVPPQTIRKISEQLTEYRNGVALFAIPLSEVLQQDLVNAFDSSIRDLEHIIAALSKAGL